MNEGKHVYTGKKIKKLRLALELNQEQMAEALNISQSYYSSVESDKKPATQKLVSAIRAKWPAQWKSLEENGGNNLSPNVHLNAGGATSGGQDDFIRETYRLLESVYNDNVADKEIMSTLLKKASMLKNKSLYYSLLATVDIRKERPELLAANQAVNEFIVNENVLHQVAVKYLIPKLNRNITYTDYASFKQEKIKQLEQLEQYTSLLKPLNKAAKKFIDDFAELDVDKSIAYYGHTPDGGTAYGNVPRNLKKKLA